MRRQSTLKKEEPRRCGAAHAHNWIVLLHRGEKRLGRLVELRVVRIGGARGGHSIERRRLRARDESERRSIDGALRHPSQRPLRLRAWHSQLSRRVHIPSLPRHNTAPPHAYRTGHRIRSSSTSTTTPHPQLSSSEECTPQHESSAFYYRSQTPHSKSSLCHSRLCHSRSLHHPLPFAGRTSNK